jgi:hypothetical protein
LREAPAWSTVMIVTARAIILGLTLLVITRPQLR